MILTRAFVLRYFFNTLSGSDQDTIDVTFGLNWEHESELQELTVGLIWRALVESTQDSRLKTRDSRL
jgi:hypothetical protein